MDQIQRLSRTYADLFASNKPLLSIQKFFQELNASRFRSANHSAGKHFTVGSIERVGQAVRHVLFVLPNKIILCFVPEQSMKYCRLWVAQCASRCFFHRLNKENSASRCSVSRKPIRSNFSGYRTDLVQPKTSPQEIVRIWAQILRTIKWDQRSYRANYHTGTQTFFWPYHRVQKAQPT